MKTKFRGQSTRLFFLPVRRPQSYNRVMESVIRNVKDIEGSERQYLESALGRKLQDNQQVVIRVINLNVEPPARFRDQALSDASDIARQGRSNAAAEGVTAEEAGTAIDEAIEHIRSHDPECI